MPATTAADIKHRLLELQLERSLAAEAGLLANAGYSADLDEEIAATRHAYVGSAVTEIASLRGSVGGRLQG